MTERCPTCHQEIKTAFAAAASAAQAPAPGSYVKIMNPDGFRDLCDLLLRSPNCTDPGFRRALEDFPGKVAKYHELSDKQVKFFKVIHQKVLGTWPSMSALTTPVEAKAEVKSLPLPEDDSDIPF